MAADLQAINCPSCGAPLKLGRRRRRHVRCDFCGTTMEDKSSPEERASGSTPTLVITSAATRPAVTWTPDAVVKPAKRVTCVGTLVSIVVGIAILAGIAMIFLVQDKAVEQLTGGIQVYSFGHAHMIPSLDDTLPDVVGVTRNSDDTNRMVYVDFDADEPLRWQSEPLGEEAVYAYAPVSWGQSVILIAAETELTAFNRADGSLSWQATLSDKIINICQDCLQLFGDRVVALTSDGVLHGLDAQTGEAVWSQRLNETPRQLLNLGGRAAVLDKEDELVGLTLYDPATGERVLRAVPGCPNDVFEGRPQRLNIYDPLLLSGDGSKLYIPIGTWEPGCILRWDAASLAEDWRATLPTDVTREVDDLPPLLTEKSLYLSSGEALYSVNMADGVSRELYRDEDHEMAPLIEKGGALVVLAERTRGTRRHVLLGIDVGTGQRLWELEPMADVYYERGSDVIHTEGAWTLGVVNQEVTLMQIYSEPTAVSFSTLNPITGEASEPRELPLEDRGGSAWMQVVGWHGDRFYLEMDGRLWLIDAPNAALIATWP